ncbi:GDP-mannose-dependent alpha-(1-2)-phosphatidylinositol mannosyltransferase [Aquisphaera giovannonii]|uniref:GDP-mannose-dependent alpha-(1-2)-phosphatidylinositol mannosyltransferase n=1 Tax=Aquisphaera giovannonii TaxID=406548 RepID=A0A5B9VUL1_9BACT|nr:glycosyltransferase [Aquisphaera giovannonii]QEH32073.1 GDP-mannose-dependent alpha-(1-2)-phosphatidylinositol mannosyltransferase [Aquisphaera giovannonii]
MRLLFSSIHCLLDPSSGAAIATRELLELLASRGAECRALTAGVLDYEKETTVDDALATLGLPAPRSAADLGGGRSAEVVDLEAGGVRCTILPTRSSRAERSPDREESAVFLDLATQVLERFRPDALLTYGGHPAGLELMRRARARGVRVAFHLHNFGYRDRRDFQHADVVIFPSEFSRRHHARLLGLDGPAIPYPIDLPRVIVPESNRDPRYVTFVNPQLEKGVTVFARIAIELNARRPDIPLLVVEGRGTADTLNRLPVNLSGLSNVQRMANTPDPRNFYRVSRAVLVPSLWLESLGRVAVEAMANGIPVLASDRGALPETLGNAGFLFTIPGRYTPDSIEMPTAREVAPWLAILEKLWDAPDFEARHRAIAYTEANRWDPAAIGREFEPVLDPPDESAPP